jgi:tetratricopeptide (TPR) repeat protein
MPIKRPPGAIRAAFWLIVVLLVTGCGAPLQIDHLLKSPDAIGPPVELTAVPFFSQEDFQCGPAALATVLNWSGTVVTPEALAPQVYLPERQGSLQVELLAATRRVGRIPYLIQPRLETLLAEVRAGNPVLVLQNLGLSWYAKWHYAVVVGFDLRQDLVILRSGRERRHVVPFKLFERTWRRSDYWAMVALPPDRLPASAEEMPYLRAVAGLEQLQRWQEAKTAYASALTRWPGSTAAHMGLGNSLYAMKDLSGAEQAYRQVTLDAPTLAPAFNNLAQVLAEQGRLQEAEQAARRAVNLGGPLLASYEETLQQILARRLH